MKFKNFLISLFISIVPLFLWGIESKTVSRDRPYFSYTDDELKELSSIPISKQPLTIESFTRWDGVIDRLPENTNFEGASNRLMAYLYTAQHDFALISYQIANQWMGNPSQLI